MYWGKEDTDECDKCHSFDNNLVQTILDICFRTINAQKYDYSHKVCKLFTAAASNFKDPKFSRCLNIMRKEARTLMNFETRCLKNDSFLPLLEREYFPKKIFYQLYHNLDGDISALVHAFTMGLQFRQLWLAHREPNSPSQRKEKIVKDYFRIRFELTKAWLGLFHGIPCPISWNSLFSKYKRRKLSDNRKFERLQGRGVRNHLEAHPAGADSPTNNEESYARCDMQGPFPREIWERIFSLLPCQTSARVRQVCRYFNVIVTWSLNGEFRRVSSILAKKAYDTSAVYEKLMLQKGYNEMLPPEVCKHDMVYACLASLHFTWDDYIKKQNGCFYVAKIVDHLQQLFSYPQILSNTDSGPDFDTFAQVLLNLTERAIVHYNACVKPRLKENLNGVSPLTSFSSNNKQ